MFGIFAVAEAVEHLLAKAGRSARYGHDAVANALGYKDSARLTELVAAQPQRHVWQGRAMLHKNRAFLSGMTISGGAPTLQAGFSRALFNAVHTDPDFSKLTC